MRLGTLRHLGLLAALLGLARPARAEVQGRAAVQLSGGSGYASDIFLGAGYNPSASANVAPAGIFDLSFSPGVKLFTEGEAHLEHYFGTGGTAYLGYTEALLQLRPSRWLYPELFGSAQASWFQDLLGPADPTQPTLPGVTRSQLLTGGLGLRTFAGQAQIRLLLLAGQRVSTGARRYVEVPLDAQLSAGSPAGRYLHLGGYLRYTENRSAVPGFYFRGVEASAFLRWWPWGRLALRLGASFRHDWNDQTGETDDFPRGSLSASVRLWGPVWLEAAGSDEREFSHNPTGTAVMDTVYLGLRAMGGPWRF